MYTYIYIYICRYICTHIPSYLPPLPLLPLFLIPSSLLASASPLSPPFSSFLRLPRYISKEGVMFHGCPRKEVYRQQVYRRVTPPILSKPVEDWRSPANSTLYGPPYIFHCLGVN